MWVALSPFAEMYRASYLDRWDPREEGNQEKDDGFWLMWGIFKEYIKQNITMAVLGKANFHLVDICRLIKNDIKKDQGGKLIQTLILSKLPNLFQRFLEERIWFML